MGHNFSPCHTDLMGVVSYMRENGLTKTVGKGKKSNFVQARQAALHAMALGPILANNPFEF